MTAAIILQLLKEDRLNSENAEFVYQSLVRDEATSSSDTDTDTDLARRILEAAGKTVGDLARDVDDYRARVTPRVVLIQRIVDSGKLAPAIKAAKDARRELQGELDRLTQPLADKIAKCNADLVRFATATDGARTARLLLIDRAPDWLRDAMSETKRDINLLQSEADLKLRPIFNAAIWCDGQWVPPVSSAQGHCSIEARQRYDDFMVAKAADNARIAALQPRISALKERRQRLEDLACASPWPLPSDIERIDRELAGSPPASLNFFAKDPEQ